MLLARCLLRKQEVGGGIKEAFNDFERLRRKRIEDAYKESQEVVSSVRHARYVGHALKMGIIPIFLWMGRSRRLRHFEEDVTLTPLGFEDVAMSSSSSMLLLRSWTDGFTASELFKSLWYRLWSAWSVKKLKAIDHASIHHVAFLYILEALNFEVPFSNQVRLPSVKPVSKYSQAGTAAQHIHP